MKNTASEKHTSRIMKCDSESNNRQPPKGKCTITKDIFNSEAKGRVKDMLVKALQLQQTRLNTEQSGNTIDLDDCEDFKEAPRFKRSLRLKNKSLSSSSSSVTNVSDVIVIDPDNQPDVVVHAHNSSDKLPQSNEDGNGCEEFTHLKSVEIISLEKMADCGPEQRSRQEAASALPTEVSTDQVQDNCRTCLVCAKSFDLLAFKTHSIDCLRQNFSKLDKNKAVTEGSVEQVKCHICNKNITFMNSQRRQQHVNNCIDKEDVTRQEEIEHQRQIEVARTAVLNCPMCGKKFKVQSSRQSHLKKCALNNKMTVEQVKNLVKQQEEEHQSKLNIGILPDDFIPPKLKPTLGKQPSSSRLKSQLDEDTQLALALSTSLAEDQGKDSLAFNGLLGNTNFGEHIAPASKGHGKSKKAKTTETASLLVCLTREEAMKRISDRVTRYTFPPNHRDSDPTTPPFKTAHGWEFRPTLSAASSSVKSYVQGQPDWWPKASQTASSEDPSWPETSSEASRVVSYYVKELMPAVSLNSVVAGSKVKRVSCIPGRRRSGEVEQQRSTVGPGEMDQQPDIIRSSEMKQQPGIVDAGPPVTISPLERFVSQASISSPLSQTVDILTRLAMESELDNGESICSQMSSHQPDIAGDSDDGEYTVEASGFCKESPIKVWSGSNDIVTSYLGLVNCPSFSDLVIMTRTGAEVQAHKIVLLARCPALLHMSFKKDGRDVVDLTAYSLESVLCFLKYVYAGRTSVYGSCQADVTQMAERFSVAGWKAATSISDMGSLTVEDVQQTTGIAVTSDIDADSNEGEDGNERNTFDDADWLDIFQTQRDNMRQKSEGTSTGNGQGDAQSGGDSDMDADNKEEDRRNGRNSFDDNEWQDVFRTQQDNISFIDNGLHECRSRKGMEQSEEIAENINTEIEHGKLLNSTNKQGYNASGEQTAVDKQLTSMELENDDEVLQTVCRQFCVAKYNSSEDSKDLHVADANVDRDTGVFVSKDEKVKMLPQILPNADYNESKDARVFISEEEKVEMLPEMLGIAENNEPKGTDVFVNKDEKIHLLPHILAVAENNEPKDTDVFVSEEDKVQLLPHILAVGENNEPRDTDVFVSEEDKVQLLPHILAVGENNEPKDTDVFVSEEDKVQLLPHILAVGENNEPRDTNVFVSEEDKVQLLPHVLAVADNNDSRAALPVISDKEDMILDNKDSLNNMLFKNEQCKSEVGKLEDVGAESEDNTELTLAPDGAKQNTVTRETQQDVCNNETSWELSGISGLENSFTNEISLESSKLSLLENSPTSDRHLHSSTVNVLESSSFTCANQSTDETKNLSVEKNETAASGSKIRKKKKNRVGVKEFTNIVHRALSGISTTCQPLADLTDEDISKIYIKIEQGLGAVGNPNDSVYIPNILEDTGESSNEVIITHADIKTALKQNRRPGKKSLAKAKVVNQLSVEHSKTVENLALVTQDLCAGNAVILHDKPVLWTDSTRSSFKNGSHLPTVPLLKKLAPQISTVTNVHSVQVTTQKTNKDPSVVTPTSHWEISTAMQISASKTTPVKLSPLQACSGAAYLAKLLEKCVKSQAEPCSSQSLNNSPCASATAELNNSPCASATAELNNSPCASATAELVGKECLTPKTLFDGISDRAPAGPSKAFPDVSINCPEDILRNCHSRNSASMNSSLIPKRISPSAKSTHSEYISGEELFTDSEEDPEPSKTRVTYRSPSDPSWILSTQQISCSPAREASVDASIMREATFVRRNIFLQELAKSASVIKTARTAEISTSVSGSGSDVQTDVTQPLTGASTGNTVKDARLKNRQENLIFKQPGRNLTSCATSVSDNNNSTSVDNTQLNILIDLSMHVLHQPDPALCVENPHTAADAPEQVLPSLSSPKISSLKPNKDTKTVIKKKTESAASPEAYTSATQEVFYPGQSKTTTQVNMSQSSAISNSRKAADSQIRSRSRVTNKASSVDGSKPCPIEHVASDNSLHLPTTSSASFCHLRTSQKSERHKPVIVTQSSLDKKSQTVITSTDEPSLKKHLNSIQNMDTRPSCSKTSNSISRFSKSTESLDWASHLETGELVPTPAACEHSQSSRHTAKATGHAECRSDSVDRVHTREDTTAGSKCDSDKSTGQILRKLASEQNMLLVRDHDNYSHISANGMLELGGSSCENSKSSTNETFSEGTVSKPMLTVSSGESVTSKPKLLHRDKAFLSPESDSSGLDSPLPLRKRLGVTNPFQRAGVKQPREMTKTAASATFPNPESCIPKENLTGQNEIQRTSINNQDIELDDDDDLLGINEAQFESMHLQFSEKTDNPKTPKQQTVRRPKNVKKSGNLPSPFTPMAPYDDMATPELKKAASRIGVRPLGKKRMRELLKRVYHETHQYETDTDYEGTPVKHGRSSSQPVELSTRAVLSHLPIKAAGDTYAQTKMPPAKKANSNKVNQTEKKDKCSAVVKHKLTSWQQKSRSQPHTQETLERRTLGNEGLISDECILPLEDPLDKDNEEVSGSQDSSFSSDGPDLPEESILQGWPDDEVPPSNQVQSNQQAVTERLVQFVKSNPDVYESILMYEPLALDVLKKRIADSGIRVSMQHLMDFLDDRYITFTMKNMSSRNNNRQRRTQKSGKSPSKSKTLSQQPQVHS